MSEHLNPVPFVLQRYIPYPKEIVFRAWTDKDALDAWFGPKGFKIRKSTLELRPGGTYHYGLQAPNGEEMWGKWTFRDIVPGERLVFISSFSNAEGGATRHTMAPVWPLETLSTILFSDDNGGTTLSMHAIPLNATAEEIAVFESASAGMNAGWTGTLEKLETALADGDIQ